MASLLAQQDQENLTYGHQTIAASKSLNQAKKALLPKTPGIKTTKTPFRLPLNDENGIDARKASLKKGKGKGDVFVTPNAPKGRAPLGQKTTNAKAKPFQTPKDDPGKSKQASSARKPRVRVSHTEPVKIDVLSNQNEEEEPEIEYMPPRAQALPDIPDDIGAYLDITKLGEGTPKLDFYGDLYNTKGSDGLTVLEREEIETKRSIEKDEQEATAHAEYTLDCVYSDCRHEPECPTQVCKDAPEINRKAKEKLEKSLADIQAHFESLPLIGNRPPRSSAPVKEKKVNITKGPSTTISKNAASALSMPKTKLAVPDRQILKPVGASKFASVLASRPKRPTQPTNPSSMRHTAAVATSNTTMGYSKGRAASASLRKAREPLSIDSTSNSKKTTSDPNNLFPEDFMKQHGEPRFMSEMWVRCRQAGLIEMPGDEDRKKDESAGFAILGPDGKSVADYGQEEAEKEFEMTMPF